jgi:excisionase family DNA binding protein
MRRQDGDMRLSKDEINSAFSDPLWAREYPPILNVDQAARLLQVPRGTLYDWSSRGLLRGCSRRVGKHLRFFRDRLITTAFNEGLGTTKI